MRNRLETIFDQVIGPTTSAGESSIHFEKQAGVHVEAVRDLASEVADDLDPQRFGIGWWAPHPDDKRRIFISDYLAQLTTSVSGNLVEAALHLLEAEAASEASSEQMKRSIVVRGSDARGYETAFEFPRKSSLADYLPDRLTDLHLAGFFRAIGSTLDTLAGVAVAVGAFDMPIVRVDFGRLLDHLKKTTFAPTRGGGFQERIRAVTVQAIQDAGPTGWLEWALGYRNMLVHRGRRTQIKNVVPDGGPTLLDDHGRPIPRARIISHLARDPTNSDLQAYFGTSIEPTRLLNLLEEDGVSALRATLEAVLIVTRSLSLNLLEVWRLRRAAPEVLLQPRAQWPDVGVQPDLFAGFKPGSVPVDATSAHMAPRSVQRLSAAAIGREQRWRWRTFTDK